MSRLESEGTNDDDKHDRDNDDGGDEIGKDKDSSSNGTDTNVDVDDDEGSEVGLSSSDTATFRIWSVLVAVTVCGSRSSLDF